MNLKKEKELRALLKVIELLNTIIKVIQEIRRQGSFCYYTTIIIKTIVISTITPLSFLDFLSVSTSPGENKEFYQRLNTKELS